MSPAVGILVGGDADLPILEGCTARLENYGIEYEVEVRDVHKNPESISEYAGTARARGLKVLICAAGMSAHLAGAVATRTNLPVIGIPIAAGTLDGFDALVGMVQTPESTPVATVAVNGAANAAVLAAQILALSDPELAERLEERT